MNADAFKYWRLCAWSGPIFLIGFIFFWGVLGSNIPPVSPSTTPAELAAHYLRNANSLRAGFVSSMTIAVFYMIWSVAIYNVMQRMEAANHVLSQLELFGGALTIVFLTMGCSFWLAAAFRPDRDPAILQMLYDVGWLTMDCAFYITTVQMIAMAVLFLTDEREAPLVPKWFCWYSIWVAFVFFTELIMPFFKRGLFAWDGLINYWVGFFAWFFWIIGQSYYTLTAISRLERECYADRAADKRPSTTTVLPAA
jgi:uncharacterized protein with GYD domain